MTNDDDWNNMPLNEAVRSILKPDKDAIMVEVEGRSGLKRAVFGALSMNDFLEHLHEHPDLMSRPSDRARIAAIKKVLSNDPHIQPIGHAASRRYLYLQGVIDFVLQERQSHILTTILMNGGEKTFDEHKQTAAIKMVFSDSEHSIEPPLIHEALKELAGAGFIELNEHTAKMSPEMWFTSIGASKEVISFTASDRFDTLVHQVMRDLQTRGEEDEKGWLLNLKEVGLTEPIRISKKARKDGWPMSKAQVIELALITLARQIRPV